MGVSGAGKSTVGELLAARLGMPYLDGDDLHLPRSITKMSAGVPLLDADRLPWLHRVGGWLATRPDGGVIACSALRRSYRDLIRETCPDAVFIHVLVRRARPRITAGGGHSALSLLDCSSS